MKTEPREAMRERIKKLFEITEEDVTAIEANARRNETIALAAFKKGQSSPKIKQLEWLDDNFPYRGCSVFVDYIISNKIGSRYTVILDIGTGIYINSFKTIDEAKAAAQADFEKRVMECLE